MKTTKKLLAIVLCFVMLFSSVAAGGNGLGEALEAFVVKASAEVIKSGETGEGLTWVLDSDGVLTFSGEGEMGNEGHYNPSWTNFKRYVKSVSIGEGVTNICAYAFSGCTELTDVVIGADVKSIGDNAFNGCTGLTGITLPGEMTGIGNNVFENCTGITEITVPDKVKSLGDNAFSGCSGLNDITIGKAMASLGKSVFSGCSSLTKINWNARKCDCFSRYLNVFGGAGSAKDGIEVVFGNTVQEIPNLMFDGNKNLRSVVVGNNVKTIGYYAFNGCSGLQSITMGNSVSLIDEYAFSDCSSLKKIVFPDSLEAICLWSFSGCTSLSEIDFGEGVEYIGSTAFDYCTSLTSVTIPDSVTTLSDSVFQRCFSLRSVIIGSGVKNISYNLFRGCTALKNISIPETVTSINDLAFVGCTALSEIVIPDSVVSIGSMAFDGCKALKSVYIGTGVVSIGEYAFRGCSTLREINWNAKNCEYDDTGKYGYSRYAFDSAGTEGSGITVTFGDSVETIPEDLFYAKYDSYRPNIKTVVLGKSVNTINREAFVGCTNLTDVYFDGSEIDKMKIEIFPGNDELLDAEWHYNSVGPLVSYTVTLDANGHGETSTRKVTNNSLVPKPADPVAEGYTFGGWFKESSCSTPWNFSTDTVTSNVSLYAKWEIRQFTISFNSNGGTAISPITQDYGTKIEAPAVPVKNGYTFVRWEPAIPSAMPAGNLTVKAVWSKNDDNPGGDEPVTYNLPVFGSGSAPYKTIVTVTFSLPDIPAGAEVWIDGVRINESAGKYSMKLGQLESDKTFRIEVKKGDRVLDGKDVKVSVDNGLFARIISFFVNCIFNDFLWRERYIDF